MTEMSDMSQMNEMNEMNDMNEMNEMNLMNLMNEMNTSITLRIFSFLFLRVSKISPDWTFEVVDISSILVA